MFGRSNSNSSGKKTLAQKGRLCGPSRDFESGDHPERKRGASYEPLWASAATTDVR
jgi:hypothetical protein